ncbi:MAG: class I SAM-dependent methyltransferase [Spirochaetota bacterium]
MSSRTLQMNDKLYSYLLSASLRETESQKKLRETTQKMRAGAMQISPEQGQFMALLVRLIGAKRTLEIGVFTGYSTLSVALALPANGRIIACDVDKEWTDIAQRHWQEAGVRDKIDLRLAPAKETLDRLLADKQGGTFDFAFIDADKINYDAYYEACLQLLRRGGLLAIDNVLWGGKTADETRQDPDTQAIRALNEKLYNDERIDLSLLPVGDGLTLARVR